MAEPVAVEATRAALPAAGALPAHDVRETTDTHLPSDAVANADEKRMIWVSAQNIGLTKEDLDEMLAELRGADTADMGTITADEVPVIVGLIDAQGASR